MNCPTHKKKKCSKYSGQQSITKACFVDGIYFKANSKKAFVVNQSNSVIC
jgi:hypothetical protein